jgi:hypothetical protein
MTPRAVQAWQRAERQAPSPHMHRVLHPWSRRRSPAAGPGRVVGVRLAWWPESCPKCGNRCLRAEAGEASCLGCGWAQVVAS